VTRQRPDNDNKPEEKPAGPRTPYPADHPGISEQPGTEPDYLPGKSPESLPKM
jgi:hypothetical protein